MNDIIEFAKNNKDAFLVLAAMAAVCMTALTSVVSFIGIIYQKKMDFKLKELEAIRKLYDNNLQQLGDAAYEVLAQATILVKKFEKTSENPSLEFIDNVKKVKQKISDSKKTLIDSRRKNRYVLIGVEDAFQKIARIGDWVKNFDKNIKMAKKLIKVGTKLRKIADNSIVIMYRYGKMPGKITLLRIKYHCWKADKMWEKSRIDHLNENGED